MTDGMAGAAGASESASAGADSAIQTIKDQAFDAIAHSKDDDASDYIAERKDRDAEEAGDPSVHTPHRKQLRAERLQRALEVASNAGRSEPHQDARGVDAYQEGPEGHEDAPDFEEIIRRREDAARTTAQYDMRAEAFSRANPDYRETRAARIRPPRLRHECTWSQGLTGR